MRKSFLTALCAASFVISSAASAETLSPAAQAGVHLSFGGARDSTPKASLQFAAGYSMGTATSAIPEDARFEDRPQMQLALLPLLDGRFSSEPLANNFRVAGFNLAGADTSPALNAAAQERSWWSMNWGWVVVAAIAGVTIVAVTAIHDGTKEDNRYGSNPGEGAGSGAGQGAGQGAGNDCSGSVGVQVGNTCIQGP